ncbi:hypothetical protein FQN57_005289 [Myotisia sp. PD_48]|nr:hypothetical protein FQN57_005289 [Myotisia sp. PD_48]
MAQDRATHPQPAKASSVDGTLSTASSPRPGLPGSSNYRSTPSSFDGPRRHYARNHTAPRQVKETLNARSAYTNSQDDGTAEHRINQYLIKQEIGRGSFGAVHLAVDQYGQEYAVKEFSKSRLRKRAQSHVLRSPHRRHPGIQPAGIGFNSPLHRHPSGNENENGGNSLYLIKEEIAIMKKLHHNNLVSLIEVLDDPTEDSLYMVMEMCKKGVIMKVGLGEESDPYSDEQCRCWFRDLILGIEYLHAQGIVHRDIKPDNCLLTNEDVLKVVDFGVSEMFEKHSDMYTAKSAGSPAFLPPELCVVRHGDVSGRAADVWSMGVTLYCMRYGRIPFQKEAIFDLYDSIRNDPVTCHGETDEDFKDLLYKILHKDPAQRITIPGLREHPWVTKRGTNPLLSAAENTADIVGPPTEEEMNDAITRNLSHAIIVVKAVQKFKRLIDASPLQMESILGDETESHFVQPPLAMEEMEEEEFATMLQRRKPEPGLAPRRPFRRQHSSQGASTYQYTSLQPAERQPMASLSTTSPSYFSTVNPKSLAPSNEPPRSDSPNKQSISEGTRGHARDPLEEELMYLFIGPSMFTGELAPSDSPPTKSFQNDPDFLASSAIDIPQNPASDDYSMVVSESPPAADIDIYETAYREEIERITSRSRELRSPTPRVYLNRRVEAQKKTSLASFLGRARVEGKISGNNDHDDDTDSVRGNYGSIPLVSDASKRITNAASSIFSSSRKPQQNDSAKAEV